MSSVTWPVDSPNTVDHLRRCSAQPKGLAQSSLGQRPRNTGSSAGAFALKARNSDERAGRGRVVRLQRDGIRSCVHDPGALPQAKLSEPFGLREPQTATGSHVSAGQVLPADGVPRDPLYTRETHP